MEVSLRKLLTTSLQIIYYLSFPIGGSNSVDQNSLLLGSMYFWYWLIQLNIGVNDTQIDSIQYLNFAKK